MKVRRRYTGVRERKRTIFVATDSRMTTGCCCCVSVAVAI